MAGSQPVAVYALRIPPGDILVPAVPEFAAMFRVTMAAIDPTAEPEFEDTVDHKPKATLKIVRIADADFLDDDDEDDMMDMDDDEDSDDEEVNGGPSDKKLLKAALDGEDEDASEDDDDSGDDAAAMEALQKAMQSDKKGKAKAVDGEEEEESDEDEDDDDDDESLELDECVVCTLDMERQYQQPLDLVVGEGEKVFFKVSGTHTVHLTGNYLLPLDDISDSEEDDEDDYELDLEDEEDMPELLEDDDQESDELDDIGDPRVMELDDEDVKPQKALPAAGKGKNKRPANDSDEEGTLDDLLSKSLKKGDAAPPMDEAAKKLTKAERKQQKKLKNNEGKAANAPEQIKSAISKEPQTNGTTPDSDKKKVQFAKNLEQGPTPSAAKPEEKKAAANLGVRDVQGVTLDDRKLGNGPAAKKGSKLELRYIGKLENGKQFDANKSGKPFVVKLGSNDVIKGWEIGLQGITAGGERRVTIPPHLAYGKKELPGIPKNSKLIFDIKCLSVK